MHGFILFINFKWILRSGSLRIKEKRSGKMPWYPHWDKNQHFIQKLHIESPNFHKIHISETSFFTKFTFSNSQFSQNSHFWNLNFHKIHIFEISILTQFTFLKSHFFTKFTFLKPQNQGNFWIKSWFLPQCSLPWGPPFLSIYRFGCPINLVF